MSDPWVLFSLLYLWRRIKIDFSFVGLRVQRVHRFEDFEKNYRTEQSPGYVSLCEWDPQLSEQDEKRGEAYKIPSNQDSLKVRRNKSLKSLKDLSE